MKKWEAEWWQEIIDEAIDAYDRQDRGTMFRLLKKLGGRACKQGTKSDFFTSAEFKEHFEKVSINRFENDEETTMRAAEEVPDRRNEQKAVKLAEHLDDL